MAKARGVPLSSLWDKLGAPVKFKVLEKVASYQELWSQVRFSQYGVCTTEVTSTSQVPTSSTRIKMGIRPPMRGSLLGLR